MSKRSKRQLESDVSFLNEQIHNNHLAVQEGPLKKSLTSHDLKSIKPLNDNQRRMLDSHFNNQNVIAVGSAGTGKTYIAMYAALSTIVHCESPQDRIVIVRSAEPTKNTGFLPGTLDEKLQVYEQPYKDILHDLTGKATMYDNLKKVGTINFVSTSYIRGLTWNNAVVIFDEVQNASFHEIDSVLTRMGNDSLLIVCGDVKQNDLHSKKNGEGTGYHNFMTVADKMDMFDTVIFTPQDIVRSGFVKSWIMAKEECDL